MQGIKGERMNLTGKVALITGAGVRIGRALALAVAQHGANVLVHYNTSDQEAREVVALIEGLENASHPRAVAIGGDLRDPATPERLITKGVKAFGHVDILINSAAIFRRGTVLDTTEADWDDHLAINLKAPFFLCQAFARQLQPDQRAHIINIADWRAMRPGVAHMAYTAAKAGLVALTKSMALALAPNVQVNAIAPGAILPPPETSTEEGAQEYFARLAQKIPVKHTGSPDEVAKAALYLLDSDFVTGEVLFVTGGEHL